MMHIKKKKNPGKPVLQQKCNGAGFFLLVLWNLCILQLVVSGKDPWPLSPPSPMSSACLLFVEKL